MEEAVIRQNKATNDWVIFAPSRGKRPSDFEQTLKRRDVPGRAAHCPFCPGNEEMLSEILLELPVGGAGDDWKTRVIPNKYPALSRLDGTSRYAEGIYLSMRGHGRHEVIIETPVHNRHVALMAPEEVEWVIETYHRRYLDVMKEHGNMMAILFRNHGPGAGTSLIHPHSQLVVTGMVPNHIRWRERHAMDYFDEWGRCVYCEILAFEEKRGARVVEANEDFLAFVPYAAEVPFEIWIMPKKHQADFGAIGDAAKTSLAAMLRQVLVRLYDRLGDPDYNYVINTAARYRSGEPQLHWYIDIRPRLTTRAGFEIGSGMSINPSLPEKDAAFLKSDPDESGEAPAKPEEGNAA